MILEFFEGLRGDLHVTLEEGTSAAWLYDLLKPHVTKLVVCDPRKNASMREGNKNDKIDARRLAELLRRNHARPRLSRGTRRTEPEGIGAQLSHHHQRSRTGHDAGEGHLPQLGYSLCRQASLCATSSCRVAREDSRNRECAGGRSFTTSNSMRCERCVSKCGGSCWRRARNTRPGNGSARFLRSVRSAPPYCWVF